MEKTQAEIRIHELRSIISDANRRYYVDNAPTLSDFEFDMLLKELEAAKKGSVMEKLQQAKMRKDYQEAVALLERIPQEILNQLREEDRWVSKTITGSLNK